MTRILYGERIGKEGKIRLGCSAVIFGQQREKIFLTRRLDNQQWCLPSGGVEAGESVEEACIREVWEETGLTVRVKRFTGVYSDPNKLVVYADGHKAQIVALNFEAEIVEGEPQLSNETCDFAWFTYDETTKLDMLLNHRERIFDALQGQEAAYIR